MPCQFAAFHRRRAAVKQEAQIVMGPLGLLFSYINPSARIWCQWVATVKQQSQNAGLIFFTEILARNIKETVWSQLLSLLCKVRNLRPTLPEDLEDLTLLVLTVERSSVGVSQHQHLISRFRWWGLNKMLIFKCIISNEENISCCRACLYSNARRNQFVCHSLVRNINRCNCNIPHITFRHYRM